jgi:protocatechuate 3,4-dioxygenase beta subunit
MKGALAALTAGKLKTVGAVLLALSLIGTGLLAGALVADPPQPAAKEPDRPTQTTAPSPAGDRKEMTVTGGVIGADGRPVAEAVVAVVGRSRRQYRSGDPKADRMQLLGEGKADAQGRFRFLAQRTSSAHFWEVYAVAAAKGHALGWLRLSPDAEQPQAVLKLPPEQVFRGRLVDLQGVPAAGVKVAVSWVGSVVHGESLGVSLADLPGQSALWPAPGTTDEKGRFVLRGLNRDQGAWLTCSGDRFATQSIEVRPVGKPRAGQRTLSMDVGGYIAEHTRGPDEKGQPEEPTITLAAAQVLEGRVVYADTGKPAAKATVLGASTDADGRFRIPLTTTKAVTVAVYAPPGTPYLNTYRRVEWPRGAVKHQVEIQLPRGVLVRGKVTEARDGAPVAGACVQFWPGWWDNPNPRPNVITGWQTCELTQADGTFQIAVLPGPGHLLFQGPTPDFIHEEIGSETIDSGRPGGSRYYPDAVVKLDLPARGDPKELAVTLRRGVTVRGRLLGADGKPVAKAVLLHRLHIYHDLSWHFSTEARDGVFEVHGLDPARAYPVYFLDAEHQWGAAVTLSGKQAGQEVTVRLVPCGKATARYLNAKGEPLANYRVSPDIVITPVGPDPRDPTGKAKLASDRGSLTNLDRHNYWDKVKTDDAGRVTFPALIPGATYHLDRWEKNNWVPHKEFTVEAGATIDLGDVTITRGE